MKQALTVMGITVDTDGKGRYCLNDLHRAAGGEARHSPWHWLRNDRAQALINELETKPQICGLDISIIPEELIDEHVDEVEVVRDPKSEAIVSGSSIHVQHGGEGRGTFVCKELVYAYAMWVSPKFELEVIRAYDALVTQERREATRRITELERELTMRKARPNRDEARWYVMAYFNEDSRETISADKTLRTGYVGEYRMEVLECKGRLYAELYSLVPIMGMSILQTKRLVTSDDSRKYQGKLYMAVDRLPEPLLV